MNDGSRDKDLTPDVLLAHRLYGVHVRLDGGEVSCDPVPTKLKIDPEWKTLPNHGKMPPGVPREHLLYGIHVKLEGGEEISTVVPPNAADAGASP